MNTSAASLSPAPRPATSSSSDASHMLFCTGVAGAADVSNRNRKGTARQYYRACPFMTRSHAD